MRTSSWAAFVAGGLTVAAGQILIAGVGADAVYPLIGIGTLGGLVLWRASVLDRRARRRMSHLEGRATDLRVALEDRDALTDRLRHQAFHDGLTGLANRAFFLERLGDAASSRRGQESNVALLFFDLDDFKSINDRSGHAAGDELLVEVARRIKAELRSEDLAARLGGDEFGVLLGGAGETDAVAIAARILGALRSPIHAGPHTVVVRASVGIAAGSGREAAADLLRNADTAMYLAKSSGKGRYEVFDAAMHGSFRARSALRLDLRRAVGHGELVLEYQPIFDLPTGRLQGLEALVRWRHPDRGLLLPGKFIPLAEETGDIRALDAWVARTACAQLASWTEAGHAGLWLALNLSGVQLADEDPANGLTQTLRELSLDPSRLLVEFGEPALLEADEAIALTALRRLRAEGIRIAVDDFGTAHSSLAYLGSLPVDILKLDGSLVREAGSEDEGGALIRALMSVGESIGLQVVGEGIETDDQRNLLAGVGINLGQGHLLHRPAPAAGLGNLLDAHRAWTVDGAGRQAEVTT